VKYGHVSNIRHLEELIVDLFQNGNGEIRRGRVHFTVLLPTPHEAWRNIAITLIED
jgi:hypothetical protein